MAKATGRIPSDIPNELQDKIISRRKTKFNKGKYTETLQARPMQRKRRKKSS